MTIKHDIEDDIVKTEHTILIPVTADGKLRAGFYATLQKARGDAYKRLAIAWADLDTEGILSKNGFVYSYEELPVLVIPVKPRGLQRPTVNIAELCRKIVNHLRGRGVQSIAISRSHWLNQRFTVEEFIALTDALEAGGLVVHLYE